MIYSWILLYSWCYNITRLQRRWIDDDYYYCFPVKTWISLQQRDTRHICLLLYLVLCAIVLDADTLYCLGSNPTLLFNSFSKFFFCYFMSIQNIVVYMCIMIQTMKKEVSRLHINNMFFSSTLLKILFLDRLCCYLKRVLIINLFCPRHYLLFFYTCIQFLLLIFFLYLLFAMYLCTYFSFKLNSWNYTLDSIE